MRHFLRSLRNRTDWRGAMPKRALQAAKYTLRSLSHYRLHSAWLAFIYADPRLCAMLAHDPRLLERPQHAYINRRLSAAASYAIMRDHYTYVLAHFPPALVEQIYLHGRCPIGQLALKDDTLITVALCRPVGRGREGELALYLLDAQDRPLSSLIFTIADNGKRLLFGCLQGAAHELGREAVRELTRQCHGLRPKNLLLSILLGYTKCIGVTRLQGVANATHPFAGRADKIKADYDSFWLDCHGTLGNDGFFELPVREPARDMAQVDSKHRSAFRKRETLRHKAATLLPQALGLTSPTGRSG
ncbi:MAG TPA: DUF535 family protein [Rhodanobacteraceae bacterium]